MIGAGLGIIYGIKKSPEQIKLKTENSLSSRVVSSIVAYGKVLLIKDRNIIVNNFGDNLTIPVPADAKVYLFTIPTKSKTPIQKEAEFSDIKQMDSVNVNLKLLPNGQFEASSVIILPSGAIDTAD
jgi:hypothetical protein